MPPGGETPAAPPTRDVLVTADERDLEALRHEVAGLRAALVSRATIDQARGILVGRYRISPEQAFNVLVRWSQHRNIKLRIIAEAVVGVSHDGPDAPEVDPDLRRWLEQQLARPAAPGPLDRLGPPVP
jgi:hypothetical protein